MAGSNEGTTQYDSNNSTGGLISSQIPILEGKILEKKNSHTGFNLLEPQRGQGSQTGSSFCLTIWHLLFVKVYHMKAGEISG